MGEQMLVPFGKYKGQPIEVLQNDPNYCNWAVNQDWFREKYPQINTLIINNFTKPEDTPEHNALQTIFLNDDAICKLIKAIEKPNTQILKKIYESRYQKCIVNLQKQREYMKNDQYGKPLIPCCRYGTEQYNYHYFDETSRNCMSWNNPENETCSCRKYVMDPDNEPGKEYYEKVEFEVCGWDVKIQGGVTGLCVHSSSDLLRNYFIEIKPCLGDDYPSVLRQMKANSKCCGYSDKKVLVYKDFTASGATIDQVKQIFECSEIIVLSISEMEVVA